MNVTLRQLRGFVLVARLGSFTRAAQAMHLSQSALSLLVRELELGMNTRLLDRTTRAIGLTAAGGEFFPEAQRILGDLEQALGNVEKLTAKEKGRLVIAAPLVLSSTYLPTLLASFQAKYPGIKLILKDTLPGLVLPLIRAGSADIGIGTFPASELDLKRSLLFTESMVAVFPAAHALSTKKEISWKDLAPHSIVALRRGSVFRDLADVGFASAGLTLTPAFEADYAGTVIGLVDAGLGIAILPGYAMRLTDSTRIGWRQIVKPVVDRDVSMIQRAGPTPSAAAQALVDFLKSPAAKQAHSRKR